MANYIQQIGETVFSVPACEINEVQTSDGRTQYAISKGGKICGIFPCLSAAKHSLACSIEFSKPEKKKRKTKAPHPQTTSENPSEAVAVK